MPTIDADDRLARCGPGPPFHERNDDNFNRSAARSAKNAEERKQTI